MACAEAKKKTDTSVLHAAKYNFSVFDISQGLD